MDEEQGSRQRLLPEELYKSASVRAAPEREPEKRGARAEARARDAQVRTPKRKSHRRACQSRSSLQPGKEVGGRACGPAGQAPSRGAVKCMQTASHDSARGPASHSAHRWAVRRPYLHLQAALGACPRLHGRARRMRAAPLIHRVHYLKLRHRRGAAPTRRTRRSASGGATGTPPLSDLTQP